MYPRNAFPATLAKFNDAGGAMYPRNNFPSREYRREEIDRTPGFLLLEFGASWCGHCLALAPHLAELLQQHSHIAHIKVEDGPGQPLGRSFRVKLWPTLVFLRDGKILRQLVRPTVEELQEGFHQLEQP
jgi:thioredoxin 1